MYSLKQIRKIQRVGYFQNLDSIKIIRVTTILKKKKVP